MSTASRAPTAAQRKGKVWRSTAAELLLWRLRVLHLHTQRVFEQMKGLGFLSESEAAEHSAKSTNILDACERTVGPMTASGRARTEVVA